MRVSDARRRSLRVACMIPCRSLIGRGAERRVLFDARSMFERKIT